MVSKQSEQGIDADPGLKPVSQKPPIPTYLVQLWQRRHFIVADARARAFQTTRGTLLGKVWLILRPFLDSMIYWVIFGFLLGTSRGIDNFPAYLVIGVNFFGIMQSALTQGSNIISGSQNFIRAFAFPRASLVVSWSLRSMLDFIPVVLATMVFVVVVSDDPKVLPTWHWLLLIPILLLGFAFAHGLALLTSGITAMFPDMRFIWPLLGRFWFYASGIFFGIDRFDKVPPVKAVMEANPAYIFLSMSRDVLAYHTVPSLEDWVYLALWSGLLLSLGLVIFWSREETYGQQK